MALDVDGAARREVTDVGKVDAAEDDPVTVDPLAERVSLREQDDTEVAGGAYGSGPAADQADQTLFIASSRRRRWPPGAQRSSPRRRTSRPWRGHRRHGAL